MFLFYLAVVCCLLYGFWAWRKNRGRPPGPAGLPIVGYLPWLNPAEPHVTLTELAAKYGPVFSLYLGNVFTVVLTDAKMIRQVLAGDDSTGRAPLYLTHGIMKGYGLICAEGELWKDQRKFLNTSLRQFGAQKFGPRRELMEGLILKEVVDCIKFVREQDGGAIEPSEVLRHNLGSAVNAVVFGMSYERDDPTWLWLQKMQEEGVKHIGVAGPLNFLPFLRHLPMYKNVMKFLLDGKEKSHEIYAKIIKERLLSKAGSLGGNVLEDFLVERERRKGTPDCENFYCDAQFYHMLADVFGAGLDTTITTLCWYLVYMAADQGVQLRVQEELDAIVQGLRVSLEDVQSLPVLEASVAETQRIRSVVPMGIPHGSTRDTTIAGYDVPKGAMIVPLQWAVHMDPALWDEPDAFRPERFIGADGRFRKPEHFIPFQTGKRMCVGDELARMLLLLFAGNILLHFKVAAPEGETLDLTGETGITLSPKPQGLIFTARKQL